MPVITAENSIPSPFQHAFVEQLVQELAGEHTPNPPMIYEFLIRPSNTLQVIVVWDQWASLPPQERSAIIVEAYEALDERGHADPPKAPRITIAMGTTWDEVDRLNLLPYRIEPNYREGEVDPEAVKRAMLDAGGIQSGNRVYLRFTARPQAEAAYAQLTRNLPNAHWSLNQVVAPVED